jgi:hypothetical protein
VFSLTEQKRPIKCGKNFNRWPKLSIKYEKPKELPFPGRHTKGAKKACDLGSSG